MSKAECKKSYLNHKLAMEAAMAAPKISRVAEIFKRKPYSCTNYTLSKETSEEAEEDGEV